MQLDELDIITYARIGSTENILVQWLEWQTGK